MSDSTVTEDQSVNITACKDFFVAYRSITANNNNVKGDDVKYQVKVRDIPHRFLVWSENDEIKSKFQGNFFDIINKDSTKILVQFKSFPSFVRYDCIDELNASILHLVCYFGLSDFVEDFIQLENCRRPGNFSYTPLHYACMNPMNPLRPGDLNTIQEIIKVAGPQACLDRSLHGYYPINYTHNEDAIQYLYEIGSHVQLDSAVAYESQDSGIG